MNKAFIQFYKLLFSFSGRSSRKEYWIAVLSHYILLFLSTVILFAFGAFTDGAKTDLFDAIVFIFLGSWQLFVLIGLLTIYFRRMRDAGQTNLISIVLFILNCIPFIQILTNIYTTYLLLRPSLRDSDIE